MLDVVERAELEEMEGVIERGLQTFYEVGASLLRIRDGRLYRDGYETFEAYCRERWDIGHQYADRLISASTVIDNLNGDNCHQNLAPIGVKPANEAQARPLARLGTKTLQQEAWQRAVETAPEGKVTARHVSSVVKEITHETRRKEVKKRGKTARKVSEEERIDEAFCHAFDAFYWEVQRARMEDWKHTSKEASLKCAKMIKDLIEVR